MHSIHLSLLLFRCFGETLRNWINRSAVSESEAQHIFKSLLQTTLEIYRRGIYHNNLTSCNIMYDYLGGIVKIINFGSASYVSDGVVSRFYGSEHIKPPEWIKYRMYTGDELSVWSLGVILYEMIFGAVPYKSEYEVLLGEFTLPVVRRGLSKHLKRLIFSCLKHDPRDRIKLSKVHCHPWVTSDL